MKRILLSIILGFKFILLSGSGVHAQNSKQNVEPNVENNFMPSVHSLAMMQNPDLKGTYILNRNEINIRAMRDFLDRYDKVKNALWFPAPNGGFEAYFVQDGYGVRILYDKNGGWEMSLITYNENKLPYEIRTGIKCTYYDWHITLVEEVHTNEGFEYIVILEDQSKIRVLRVSKEGLVEELQDLNKQSK
jgi:hypothetical protein